MDFATATKTCFRKYASFSGRASRSEFWYFQLFLALIGVVAALIDRKIYSSFGFVVWFSAAPVTLAWIGATIVPEIAASVRRLHDVGRSGWWNVFWLLVLPLCVHNAAGFTGSKHHLVWAIAMTAATPLIVWLCTRGTNGPSRFGGDSRESTADTASGEIAVNAVLSK